MSLHWTINSLPELGHLAAPERRALIRAVIPAVTRVRLVVRPLVMGLAGGLMTALLVVGLGAQGAAPYTLWPTVLAVAAVTHVLQIRRIREQLRHHIREHYAGQRSPICLSCGFDLHGSTSETCPECGAATMLEA